MRAFDYSFLKSITIDTNLLSIAMGIERLRERDANRIASFPRTYSGMRSAAMMQSVFGSNAIEGIFTGDDRLREICMRKVEPAGRSEFEIAGYRDALDEVHNGNMDLSTDMIRGLHWIMLSHTGEEGGRWKDRDNFIGRRRADGIMEIHFRPMSWEDVPDTMESLISAYKAAHQDSSVNRLLLIPCFVLDFLSIHPFLDGNGRVSRLLSLHLLYTEGYDVGRYVSLESMIYRNRSDYHRSLAESSVGWADGTNDYMPFIRNFLDTLFLCYKELDRRFVTSVGSKDNKGARVEYAVLNALSPISRRELHELLPDISDPMISKVLARLVDEGRISKLGSGPSTRYYRK